MLVYPFELGCLYVPYPIGRRPKGKALNSLKVGIRDYFEIYKSETRARVRLERIGGY